MLDLFTNLQYRLVGGRLHLGIANHGLALSRSKSAWTKTAQTLGEISCTKEQLNVSINTLLAQPSCKGLPVSVTLSHEWGQLFMVTPPAQVTQHAVLVAAAAMRFQALFGKDLAEWQIEADWQTDRPFLACAYPRTLMAMLRDIAMRNRTPLLSVRPYFVEMWNAWSDKLNAASWFGVVNDEVLTLGLTSSERATELIGIRSIPIPEQGYSIEWIEDQLHRTALQNGLEAPDQIQVVGNYHRYWAKKNASLTEQYVVNLDSDSQHTSASPLSAAGQLIMRGVKK